MQLLSSQNRDQLLEQLANTKFDLLIIGGGITGAGIALDATTRGLKVALIEKNDFASGTSSKSTKLIHGGLRYLKQFEVKLVREVGKERAIVHKLAPHLVKPEKMLLPLIQGGTYGPLMTSVGLWVYDFLADVKGKDKRKMLSAKDTLKQEPLLEVQKSALKGSGYYAEYRTDDARLTMENLKTAVSKGAFVANYVKGVSFQKNDSGQVEALHCQDELNGGEFTIQADFIVSAAGPWVDTIREEDRSLKGKKLFLSKGVHIVVPRERFPIQQAIYFDVPDGRMIFAIPRLRVTYIGTTDTPYDGDSNNIPILKEDIDYLLEATNNMFPNINLQESDIESSWAGLRPLIYEEGKSASEMSRKDEIFESNSGLISIAGGKLTGYRKMAERIVDLVGKKFEELKGVSLSACQTKNIPLTGGPFQNDQEVDDLILSYTEMLKPFKLGSETAAYLVANYGKQTEAIIELLSKEFQGNNPHNALARAEAYFCINNEQAQKLTDFYDRRTGRLYFNLPSIEPTTEAVIDVFASELGWSDTRIQKELEELNQAIYVVAKAFKSSSAQAV